jgi:nucleoside-diphosphate-sugar epimerase
LCLPVREDAAIAPVSPYGYHKAIQEGMLREYAELFGLPGSIARVFSVFGPGQRKLAVWEMAQRAIRGDFSVRGTGVETRDYLFVEDVAPALNCQLMNAPCAGEAINVGSGESWTMRDMAEALYSELGLRGSPVFDGQASPGTPLHWCADVARLRALGFQPQIGVREGLRRTARWILQNA